MTCKTHIAAAAATSLLFVSPATVPALFATLGAATLGGTISDLDVVTSDSHKYADLFTFLFFGTILVLGVLEYLGKIEILSWIRNNSSYLKILVCGMLFVAVSFFGMHKPHRSLLHSVTGFVVLTLLFYLCLGKLALAFSIGMASHIFLDMLNKKGLQLYYPLKGRYCLKLFDSDKVANNILFAVFLVLFIVRLFSIKSL